MVAEAEIICHQSIQVVDVQYRCIVKSTNIQNVEEIDEISAPSSSVFQQIRASVSIPTETTLRPGEQDLKSGDTISDDALESSTFQFVPTIRSGSFADIGPRKSMEDEHIKIDDLSSYLGSSFKCPNPSAFYGVFDGHGGSEASSYMRQNAIRFFFEDGNFQQMSEGDDDFMEEVESTIRKAFLLADLALADDCTISSSSGTTAITALILGRILLVANTGDCRAVLCRKGEAIEMSQDHKPIHPPERFRVEQSGGYIEDGYLNGVLSVTRALGDWDMKFPRGSTSPLIADPEFRQVVLTDEDEFLIIGCDGIWDVMSSQHAVSIVRRGLRRHDDPEKCARDLVMEALALNTFDNLTVIVVCFLAPDKTESSSSPQLQSKREQRLRCCSLSAEAMCNLRRLLEEQ